MKIKKRNYFIMFGTISIILLIGFIKLIIDVRNQNMYLYNQGVTYLNTGEYKEAMKYFKEIQDYQNYMDVSDLLQKYNICPECGQVIINNKEQNNE